MKAVASGKHHAFVDDYAARVQRINRHYSNARLRFVVFVLGMTAWALFRLWGG